MNKKIKVKCNEAFTIFNNDSDIQEGRTISAVVEEKEYTATLYELTQEYFAKDDKGREFLVGEINIDEKLILEEEFELIN